MKTVFIYRVYLIAIFLSFFHCAFGEYIEKDGIRYGVIKNEKAQYVRVCRFDDDTENKTKYSGVISIPDSIEYNGHMMAVDALGERVFDGCSNLEELILPGENTKLEKYSIANCGNIKINFPKKVGLRWGVLYNTCIINEPELPEILCTSFGFFSAMPWLTKYSTSSHLTMLGSYTFVDSNISEIEFNNEKYDELILSGFCFSNCKAEEIRLPDRSLTIYDWAFADFPALKKLTFRNSENILIGGNDQVDCDHHEKPDTFITRCPNLAEIISESPTPPDVLAKRWSIESQTYYIIPAGFCFMGDNSRTFLRVPAGSEKLYAEHPVWGQFVNISDFEGNIYRSTQINEITREPSVATRRIVTDGNSPLCIPINTPSTITIYDINGAKIFCEQINDGEFTKVLAPGVYIVRQTPKVCYR